MMHIKNKIYDIERYSYSKKKIEELEPVMLALDNICDILYNSLGNKGILKIIEVVEDVRIEYYLKHYEYQQVVKSKGKRIDEL